MTTIDRATAARINPLISDISSKDTLASCAELVRAMGYAVASADQSVCSQMFRMANAVAAAVEFESEGA
jgi:2C-methyl-D-erythritol 2,4-cyclodiphosphate synthase